MLAKAVARESGATFINVSAAAVHSKWAGDSEKAISALFAIARKNSPCVIFIDEVDSLLRARGGVSGDGSGAGSSFDRKIVNMFLQEWDGLCSKLNREARVTVLGATNRPHGKTFYDCCVTAARHPHRRRVCALVVYVCRPR